MAEKSLFFNALPDQTSVTGYDRNYNADDISDWLSMMLETGVVKDGLKVEVATGLNVKVNVGRAAIKGKGYINNAIKSFAIQQNGTANTRYDYIKLKYDNTTAVRDISLELVTGTSTAPTISNLTRNDTVYELMLAIITVNPSATSVSIFADKRGDATLCPWFTAVKGYEDYYDAMVQTYESVVTMAAAGTQVITTLPSNLYNTKYSTIEVYTNGIKEQESAYTVSTSGGYIVITFTATKSVGAKITVDLGNYIDGEGMSTALAQYTQWTQDVAKLKTANEYNYICNGTNDNVLISNLVKTFLNGGTDYGSMKLNIVGTFGYTAMAGGGGTSSNPYKLFDFTTSTVNRKVTLDFTNCKHISVTPTGGTYTVIFNTTNINIIGANISANQTGDNTIIRVFNNSTGQVKCTDCRFWVNGYQDSIIAMVGTFENCRASVSNVTGNSYAFLTGYTGILRLFGGEYYAYTGATASKSAIVGQSGAQALAILYGVNAPTAARSGFYQTNAIYQLGGWVNCTDLITNLTLTTISGQSNIRGTIAMDKPNQM